MKVLESLFLTLLIMKNGQTSENQGYLIARFHVPAKLVKDLLREPVMSFENLRPDEDVPPDIRPMEDSGSKDDGEMCSGGRGKFS